MQEKIFFSQTLLCISQKSSIFAPVLRDMFERRQIVVWLLIAGSMALYANEGEDRDTALVTGKQLSLQEVLVVSHKAEVQSDAYRLITQVSRAEIETLPIQTMADILQYLPGVDVRTRGANGVQADISMRGGTFDQVLVLVNGVNLSDFQTGHYTLNIPISSELIERVEVLQGSSANLVGAFSGAINIITRSEQKQDISFGLTAGMNGLVNPMFAGSWQAGEVHVNTSAEYSRADGYSAPNPSEKEAIACRNMDFQLMNLYLQTRWRGLDVQAGAQWKDAGLGMGYGFGSQDQFDATRTAFASAKYAHRWNTWRVEAQATYRANHDRYEWHRGQQLYSNRHFTQSANASFSAHYTSRVGTTSAGIGLRNESIRSTNLGDHNRIHLNYYAEQRFYYAGLSASIGISGAYNTQFGNHWTGEANIGYAFKNGGSIYINAHRSLRMPTFTDLYYNAGNQLGSPELHPEEAWTLSAGYQMMNYPLPLANSGTLSITIDGYYRWGRNIIDWVYVPEDAKRPYHAANQQQVNATGVELSVAYHLNEWLRTVAVDYSYTYLDLDVKQSGSRYLDYLSHKLAIRLEHGIYKGFGASWTLRFQKRDGQYNDAQGAVQDYQPVWLLDGSVYWQNTWIRISADCTNITHRRYYDYGGILQPGAWAKIQVKVKI